MTKRKILALVAFLFLAVPSFAQVQPTQFLGDYVPTSTFQCYFSTFRYDTGAPATLAGTPAVKVYKDGDATSEVTTGLTLNADFDSKTGLNEIDVDTSDGFYVAGHDYTVVITTGTVNTVSVIGFSPCRFSIGRGVNLKYVNGGSTGSTAGKLELTHLVVSASDTAPAVKIEQTNGYDAILAQVTGTNHGGDALDLYSEAGPAVYVEATVHNGVAVFSDAEARAAMLLAGSGPGSVGLYLLGNSREGASGFGADLGQGLYILGGDAGASFDAAAGIAVYGGGGSLAHNAGPAIVAGPGLGDGGITQKSALATIAITSTPSEYGGNPEMDSTGNTDGIIVEGSGTGKAINALGQVAIAPANTNDAALVLTPNGTGKAISASGLSPFGGIPKNTAVGAFPFVMYSTSGSPLAGLTVTCTVSLDGGAFGACTNSPAAIGSGAYKVDLAAADTNGSTGVLKFTATGARTVLVPFVTQQ
jgi:hypothetical protein